MSVEVDTVSLFYDCIPFFFQQTNSHFHLPLSIFIIQCIFEHDIHSPFKIVSDYR